MYACILFYLLLLFHLVFCLPSFQLSYNAVLWHTYCLTSHHIFFFCAANKNGSFQSYYTLACVVFILLHLKFLLLVRFNVSFQSGFAHLSLNFGKCLVLVQFLLVSLAVFYKIFTKLTNTKTKASILCNSILFSSGISFSSSSSLNFQFSFILTLVVFIIFSKMIKFLIFC